MLEFHSLFYVGLFTKVKFTVLNIQLFTFFPTTMKCPLINVNNELIINSVQVEVKINTKLLS